MRSELAECHVCRRRPPDAGGHCRPSLGMPPQFARSAPGVLRSLGPRGLFSLCGGNALASILCDLKAGCLIRSHRLSLSPAPAPISASTARRIASGRSGQAETTRAKSGLGGFVKAGAPDSAPSSAESADFGGISELVRIPPPPLAAPVPLGSSVRSHRMMPVRSARVCGPSASIQRPSLYRRGRPLALCPDAPTSTKSS